MEKTLFKQEISTPLGPMVALASEEALCCLEFRSKKRMSLLKQRLNNWYPSSKVLKKTNGILEQVKVQLAKYFDGDTMALNFLKTEAPGTDFEKKVWKQLRKIPAGEVVSYSQVAKKIGKPKAARAVGGASRRNPLSLIVPCHRVVGASGKLTGYGGGLPQKNWLLKHEECPVTN